MFKKNKKTFDYIFVAGCFGAECGPKQYCSSSSKKCVCIKNYKWDQAGERCVYSPGKDLPCSLYLAHCGLKPLSHWDATRSRLFWESIRELVSKPSPNVRMTPQSPRMHRELVAYGSQKFQTCNTFLCDTNHRKTIALSHRMRRKPVALTLRRHIAI